MLSKLQHLGIDVDKHYATDEELAFMTDYVQSFPLRLKTYIKIHELEQKIVEQVEMKIKSFDPNLFLYDREDITNKWKRDTFRVLRYTAIGLLIDDPDYLKDQFLYWFQTIMQAFNAQRSCDTTYAVMQEVVKKMLDPEEADLVCPILELNRRLLGQPAER